jgi:hypothetical protein
MKAEPGPQLDAFAVDVRALLERSVASLYSHLVTRPTGRAVRMAIESQLDDLPKPAISRVDLSAVAILDYSCADEVVAKLLLRGGDDGGATFFVLTGVQAHHRDPIEAVLERHDLGVVAETGPGSYELLGSGVDSERVLWNAVEEVGCLRAAEIDTVAEAHGGRAALDRLVARRLVFLDPLHGDVHALSTLVQRPV